MIYKELSDLRVKVAELLVVRASAYSSDGQRDYPEWELSNDELKYLLKVGVGGVILFGGTTTELQARCINLNKWAVNPLLLCADIEEGLGQRFQGGTWLVPPIALGQIFKEDANRAINLAEQYGSCIGNQARRCGLNWVLAPVCDVNTNPSNPVINVRAWGEDTSTVSQLVCAFQRGLHSQGVLTCAKHFPGHGDSDVDSHIDLPLLDHDISRLKTIDLIPFHAAIDGGVNSVMSGHLLFHNIDADFPATMSKKIVNDLLREYLGFDGLLVTDALVMEAISKKYGSGEAAVLAFEAGADLILMPKKAIEAIEAIEKALISGRVPMERLQKALQRRHNAICQFKNASNQFSNLPLSISEGAIELEEQSSLSRELVRSSLKIRHSGGIGKTNIGINLLRIDGFSPCKVLSHNSPALCLPETAGYRSVVYHQKGVSLWQDDLKSPLALDRLGEGLILLQLFVRGNPFQENSHCLEPWVAAIKQLQRIKLLAGVIVYGSPYFWNDLTEVIQDSIPTAYSPGQMPEAQKQVLSALFPNVQVDTYKQKPIAKEFTD